MPRALLLRGLLIGTAEIHTQPLVQQAKVNQTFVLSMAT